VSPVPSKLIGSGDGTVRRRTASGVSKKTGEVGPPPVTHRRAVGRRLEERGLWGLCVRGKIAEKLVVVVGKSRSSYHHSPENCNSIKIIRWWWGGKVNGTDWLRPSAVRPPSSGKIMRVIIWTDRIETATRGFSRESDAGGLAGCDD